MRRRLPSHALLLLCALTRAAAHPVGTADAALTPAGLPDAPHAALRSAALAKVQAATPSEMDSAMQRVLAHTPGGELDEALLELFDAEARAATSRPPPSEHALLVPSHADTTSTTAPTTAPTGAPASASSGPPTTAPTTAPTGAPAPTSSGNTPSTSSEPYPGYRCSCGTTAWSGASYRIFTAPADVTELPAKTNYSACEPPGAGTDALNVSYGLAIPGSPICLDAAGAECDPCGMAATRDQIRIGWFSQLSKAKDGNGNACVLNSTHPWTVQVAVSYRLSNWLWMQADATTAVGTLASGAPPSYASAVPGADWLTATVQKGTFPITWQSLAPSYSLPPNTPFRFMVGANWAACDSTAPSDTNTTAPTTASTAAPTTAPAPAPTTAPASAPTTAPAPAPTTAPTTAPAPGPAPSA